MQIIKTTTLKNCKFLNLYFKQLLSKDPLDPWPIIKNASLFVAYDKDKPVSYCTIKNWGTCFELGSVVTEKKFRRKGYSSKLISEVLKGHNNLYVTCKNQLEDFYNKFGFKKIKNAPYPIKQRIDFANFFSFLMGEKYIVMEHKNS